MGKINVQTFRWTHEKKDSLISKIDHRGIHCAPPGQVFIIADLSQIEPRVINYFAGNWKFLDICRTTSVYEAAAIAEGLWSPDRGSLKKENPSLYSLKKGQILALGFGASSAKFVIMVAGFSMDPYETIGTDVTSDDVAAYRSYLVEQDKRKRSKEKQKWFDGLKDERERRLYTKSWHVVNGWRAANPLILRVWARLEDGFKASVEAGEPEHSIVLPSGRELHYYEPQWVMYQGEKRLAAYRTLHPSRSASRDLKFTYSGKLAENATQACARDVFCWHCVQIRKQLGLIIPFTVHDEAVILSPVSEAEANLAEVQRIMRTPPPWMEKLPLDCEAHVTERYRK